MNAKILVIVTSLGLSLALTGCDVGKERGRVDIRTLPKIFLNPPSISPEYAIDKDYMMGKLIVVEGCIQIEHIPGGGLVTPIWPPFAEVVKNRFKFEVKMDDQNLVFGKTYKFGGTPKVDSIASDQRGTCPRTSVWFVGGVKEDP